MDSNSLESKDLGEEDPLSDFLSAQTPGCYREATKPSTYVPDFVGEQWPLYRQTWNKCKRQEVSCFSIKSLLAKMG